MVASSAHIDGFWVIGEDVVGRPDPAAVPGGYAGQVSTVRRCSGVLVRHRLWGYAVLELNWMPSSNAHASSGMPSAAGPSPAV